MATMGQRKCLCCNSFFDPDRRSRNRQRYCANSACRIASKAASQAAWRSRPENLDYFRGSLHVARVRAWRVLHPDHCPRTRVRAGAPALLQDDIPVQVPDCVDKTPVCTERSCNLVLQDLLSTPTPLLVGLIAHLFEVGLQDDMAHTARRLVQRGFEFMHRSPNENLQTTVAS